MKKILIIDDNTDVLLSMKLLLKQHGFQAHLAERPESAMQILSDAPIDLVLQDMNFEHDTTSGKEGLDLLEQIKGVKPHVPVILFSAWAHIDVIVQGMKRGADNFFVKPWENSALVSLINDTLHLKSRRAEMPSRAAIDREYNFKNIIGESSALLAELETAGLVARTRTNVLIRGENGTGKDLLAHAIHLNSDRAGAPFVKVNTGGISTALFDSELFGHVKGAFTGAVSDRLGRFEEAHGGTIFLDEIGDLALDSQVKLLRVIQDSQFERVGANKTTQVNVRIIAATNMDLNAAIAEGAFREDLYYRLNTIELTMPPLRERGDDVLKLADFFLQRSAEKYGKPGLKLSAEGRQAALVHTWSGNVRELEHAIERAVLTARGSEVNLQFAGSAESSASDLPPVGELTLDEMEREMIARTLRETGNNLSKAAKLLGINRTSLYRRLEKYGIEVPK